MIKKILATCLFSIFLLTGFSGCNEGTSGKYDTFAKCVSDSGAVFYGTEWCPHCKDQKALFGNSIKKIRYVDCDREKTVCKKKGIEGYPTWIFGDETSASGTQSLQKLSEKTSCQLIEDDIEKTEE